MIIRTAQEQNAANCCGCDVPECATPRQVCEGRAGTATKYGYAPYVQPSGDGSDPIPTLYETTENPSYFSTIGFAALYTGWWYNSGGGYYFESLQNYTINYVVDDGVESGGTNTSDTYNNSASGTFSPISDSGSTSDSFDNVQPFFYYYSGASIATYSEALSDTYSLTTGYTKLAASFEKSDVYLFQTSEPAPSLQGAGGTADLFKHHFDVTETALDTFVLSDPFTLADVVSDAEADAEAEAWSAGSCITSMAKLYWPNIEDKDWDSLTEDEDGFNNAYFPNWGEHGPQVNIVAGRMKVGVPENYSTVEVPRSVWEQQWDYVEASDAWWTWFDGGMIGVEPTPGPSLVSSDSWTWGGSMATEADQFSDWKTIPIPTIPGECRAVNVLVTCYASTRLGVKPTAYGDQLSIS